MHADLFIAGRELSRIVSATIEPRLREAFPSLPLALAHIGPGSDVPGYDTARSMDHDWGPRLTIMVPDEACDDVVASINDNIVRFLPATIGGFPTRFSRHADGTTFSDPAGTIHRLHVTTIRQILVNELLIDDLAHLTDAVWLSTPMQSLLEITAGEVFLDDSGELTALRSALAFYPEQVLRYQLAALWMRISQIQPFVGRTGEVGDTASSAIIAATIARDLMRIGLLQSDLYAPYAKWLGTAFGRTDIGAKVMPDLDVALQATTWRERETALDRAGLPLIRQLNGLGLIPTVSEAAMQFHTRPFHILPAEDIANALHNSLRGTPLASLPPHVGGIDAVTDSTDALKSMDFRLALRTMLTKLTAGVPE